MSLTYILRYGTRLHHNKSHVQVRGIYICICNRLATCKGLSAGMEDRQNPRAWKCGKLTGSLPSGNERDSDGGVGKKNRI